ncbi:saccharopepsin [Pyricularia oryzae 70-15]|uniref:Saccharopepsin n=2 Tax=Pyricularia oryzae TaxID=318829 RepID=G4NAI0_PYRO7|nr:saccharopepsin [Pyricularia oryzae 70-15]EHA51318.1 saccharopepsin [Pyricularia oryzae 70-15]ELQ33094.1 saccharopepsin [Pyricularia oryzae Y34]KAI7920235.1 aspartic endopeptidase [Pyricularia oryzae]
MQFLKVLALAGFSSLAACSPRPKNLQAASSPAPHVIKAPLRRMEMPSAQRRLANIRNTHGQPPQPHVKHYFQSPNGTFPRTNLSNIFDGYEYMVDVTVGTPPQNISVIFDTGSDQTWLNPQCIGMSHQAICVASGSYNSSQSITAQNLSSEFSIIYGSGTVEGWYMRDTVSIAGLSAENVQFGVATYSYAMDSGILGLGYDSVFMDELQGQGKIDSKDFSVSLGPNASPNGEIVLGGVDTRKYFGPLKSIQMLDDEGPFASVLHYSVNLTYMGVTSKGSCKSTPATEADFVTPTLVDTGSTIAHLPFAAANRTAAMIPGTRFDPYTQMWKVSCHYAGSAETVDFAFGDVVVNIPMREFIWRNVPMGGQCYLGLVGDADSIGFSVLGDSFLRALVALYQPDQKLLKLAPYSDCGSDVQSSNATAENLTGKCSRPSWDTCTSRPTPVPLPASTSAMWTPSWPTTTATSGALPTSDATFLLPPTEVMTDVPNTSTSIDWGVETSVFTDPMTTRSYSTCYDVFLDTMLECEVRTKTTTDSWGDTITLSSTVFWDSPLAPTDETSAALSTAIGNPGLPTVPEVTATAPVTETAPLTTYEPSFEYTSTSTRQGPCFSYHECILTFSTPLGGTIASEVTECGTYWTCTDIVPSSTSSSYSLGLDTTSSSFDWFPTSDAAGAVTPSSDGIFPLPTIVPTPISSDWSVLPIGTEMESGAPSSTDAAALPASSSTSVFCTTSWVYVTVYSTVYSTSEPINTWTMVGRK